MVQLQVPNNGVVELPSDTKHFGDDIDSACSSPYVSAPSSPGRAQPSGYFFSAPASPVHFVLNSFRSETAHPPLDYNSAEHAESCTSEFEFLESGFSAVGSMSSADELFVNGQIKPMRLSSHLQMPQVLGPLLDVDIEEDGTEDENGIGNESIKRGREPKLRSGSLRRKARSLSPLRNEELKWHDEGRNSERVSDDGVKEKEEAETGHLTPSCSASSSRSSSSGRNSKKWVFLKELLYRSKSEGRENGKERFWSSINFSPSKEKKLSILKEASGTKDEAAETKKGNEIRKQKQKQRQKQIGQASVQVGKPANGVAKRRVPLSAHELHYTSNRAQAEEMKKRTYLPYRQGLFGCLGFTSKGYGALNGLSKSLNPVSSR